MPFRRPARLAALCVSLAFLAAGCADEIPTSGSAPGSLSRISTTAALVAGPDRHIVHFTSDAIPADFADQVASLGATVDAAYDGVGIAVVGGLSPDAVAQLASKAGVTDVDPDNAFQFVGDTAGTVTADATSVIASPGNPATAAIFPFQWNMRAIGAEAAWAAGHLGSPAVKVAILDTGIDYLHPDLAGRVDLANSASFVPTDDALVAALFPTRNRVTDLHFHGTHVAATVSSNAILAAGVSSMTTLMGVKVVGVNGVGTTSALLAGMVFAVDRGANVLNLSLEVKDLLSRKDKEIKDFEKVTNRFYQYAHKKGVTVVVAAGNSALDLDTKHTFKGYCDSQHVTCVSATGPTAGGVPGPWVNVDAPATFTNFGVKSIDLAAPGGNTSSAVFAACSTSSLVIPQCRTTLIPLGLQGTSQAAPHVSGVAALLLGKHGPLSPGALRSMLENSADDLGDSGKDRFYGQGRVSAKNAMGL